MTTSFAVWALLLAGAGAAPPENVVHVRFEGRVYTVLYERGTHDGVPIDLYYYQLRQPNGQPVVAKGVNDGEPLWNRFVRRPGKDYPDQSGATWFHIYWVERNGRWSGPEGDEGVSVEVVARPERLELRDVVASVRPASVARGSKPELIVTYTVKGPLAGGTVAVVETRSILFGDKNIKDLELRPQRAAGTLTSIQEVEVPPDAPPGVYRLEVTLQAGAEKATGSALFEVR